jgi:hypothetical protein
MSATSDQPAVYVMRYRRSKAFAFSAIMLGIGAAIAWVCLEALDPAWSAPDDNGAVLQPLPVFVRVPFMAVLGALILTPGAMMLWSGLTNRIIVRADAVSISSRTIFGRRRELPWQSIGSVKRYGRENQIVLSPLGHGGLADEIWDRKSVLIDVGMLDQPVARVESVIRLFRPDLAIQYGESRDG